MCVLWCPIRNFAIFPSSSHFLPIRLARAPARLHVHIGKFRVGEAVRFPACRCLGRSALGSMCFEISKQVSVLLRLTEKCVRKSKNGKNPPWQRTRTDGRTDAALTDAVATHFFANATHAVSQWEITLSNHSGNASRRRRRHCLERASFQPSSICVTT